MTAEGKRWYIWLRVSDKDQHPENQEPVLRQMVERNGDTVVRVFITKDSASQEGRARGKGQELDRNRVEMLNGFRRGDADGVAIWALDRLTRLGAEDLLRYLRMITEAGADVRSHQEPWLNTVDPFARAILIPLMATIAEFETSRRSERIKAGMARRKREGKPVGGDLAKRGADLRRRSSEGYEQTWEPGGKHYEDRQAKKEALLADPVRLRELHRDTECRTCGAGIGDPCRIAAGRLKGEIKSRPHAARLHVASEEQRKTAES